MRWQRSILEPKKFVMMAWTMMLMEKATAMMKIVTLIQPARSFPKKTIVKMASMMMGMVRQKMKAIVTITILRSIPTPLKPVMASIAVLAVAPPALARKLQYRKSNSGRHRWRRHYRL